MNSVPSPACGAKAPWLILSHHSFFRRKNLQAGRPPAGQYRFDEFVRQLLASHFAGETLMIVCDRNEFDADVSVADIDDRVPDVRPSVIRRTADDSGVDDVSSAAQLAMPMQTCVRADDHIGV